MITTAFENRRIRTVSCVILITVGLTACRERMTDTEAVFLSDHTRRHAIQLADRVERKTIQLHAPGAKLSRDQRTSVAVFVHSFKTGGVEQLRIAVPRSSSGHFAVRNAIEDVEDVVRQAGYGSDALKVVRVPDRLLPRQSIGLAYRHRTAIAPNCGNWPSDVGRDREALPYENFGCATRRNLAKTVRFARDLEAPQTPTPGSSQRRATTWAEYKGDPQNAREAATGSDTDAVSTDKNNE